MICFSEMPLKKEIAAELSKLKIEYVFQSIFCADGKTIYAREALMRPHGRNVLDLIREYTEKGKLHILEIASFFGATQEYVTRGYTEKLSINSFPCECFSQEETDAYVNYFRKDKEIIIIELLEYPDFSVEKAMTKKKYAKIGRSQVSLDDYGAGFNNMEKVNLIDPDIVKLDRVLLSDIDKNPEKQSHCKQVIQKMHERGIKVVAEGVETKEEFDYLVSIGADLFQGYYLERPA